MNLNELPNIGPDLVRRLQSVGIASADELKSAGAQKAFLKLITIDSTTCINTLYALEGAVQGIRWHQLDPDEKRVLLEFFKMVKSTGSSLN